jgi:hypothetical protein
MKNYLKLFSVLLIVGSFTQVTFAKPSGEAFARPYGMAGCGLGSVVIDKHGSQIFAGTTNGTSANQIFGITTGTSNCVDTPNDSVAKKMDNFIEANKATVAIDISRGEGETVQSLAAIMGCQDVSLLGSSLKNQFGKIYKTFDVTTPEVTDSVISAIMNDKNLRVSCSNIHLG